MPEEQKVAPSQEKRWKINLDWFHSNQRSAAVLLKDYLCPECAKRLSAKNEPSLKTLLSSVESCCSHHPDFLHEKLPILESAFRLFLRNGNRPMTVKELSSKLGEVRFGDIYRTAPEILTRLLDKDNFYGLQPIPG